MTIRNRTETGEQDLFACTLLSRVARLFIFKPKYKFGKILDGLKWENVDIFYGRLKYFMDNFDIL
jgi:hypothetical protein